MGSTLPISLSFQRLAEKGEDCLKPRNKNSSQLMRLKLRYRYLIMTGKISVISLILTVIVGFANLKLAILPFMACVLALVLASGLVRR